MAMPILYAARTSFRKLGRKKIRTFFGIVPTIFLLTFIVLFSGFTASLDHFVRTKILSKIELREQVIHLQKYTYPSSSAADEDSPNAYQPEDIPKVKQLAHVVDVKPERTLYGVVGGSDDLVAGKHLVIDNFTVAANETGRLYNTSDFTYRPGEPIPIIVNRNNFMHSYLDMGGKSKITLDSIVSDPEEARKLNPVKFEFLSKEFNKGKLIGRTFELQLGGLPPIPVVSRKSDYASNKPTETYEALSETEIAKLLKAQQDKISPYWDYAKLSAGVKLKFRIVAINDSIEGGPALIPTDGGTYLYQQLYNLQRSARTTKAIPQEVFDSKFFGLHQAKNGSLAISNAQGYYGGYERIEFKEISPAGQPPIPGADQLDIPGWVYKAEINGETTTYNEVTNLAFDADKLSMVGLAVTIDDAINRTKVQDALADAGYPEAKMGAAFTDSVRSGIKGLNTAMLIIVGVLAVINSLILISVVGRSIADAQREIGVYRALGARKRDVARLYMVYSALQTVIGVGVGIALGLILVVPVAHVIMMLLGKMGILAQFSADGTFSSLGINLVTSDFYRVDWLRVGEYSLALILLTILVSLIPAWRASRISPVEAIRRAD